VTEYRVVFANATPGSIAIKAEKVNMGVKKIWFYDAEDHLIAVYRWDHIIGFDVVGSASEQVFTDSLLHEQRPLSATERAEAVEQRGTLRRCHCPSKRSRNLRINGRSGFPECSLIVECCCI
jgi:hypothetical protein